jgi:hypothetical protein
MPIVSKPVLKSYFNSGDVPKESNYIDLIDSMALEGAVLTPKLAIIARNTTFSSPPTAVAVTFNNEIVDTYNFFSSSNPTRLTIPLTGYYRILGSITFPFNATGYRKIAIRLNGVSIYLKRNSVLALSSAPELTPISVITDPVLLTIGNYVEMEINQSSGATLTIPVDASNSYLTAMSIEYLGS